MFLPISEAESILKHQLKAYKPNTITAIIMEYSLLLIWLPSTETQHVMMK